MDLATSESYLPGYAIKIEAAVAAKAAALHLSPHPEQVALTSLTQTYVSVTVSVDGTTRSTALRSSDSLAGVQRDRGVAAAGYQTPFVSEPWSRPRSTVAANAQIEGRANRRGRLSSETSFVVSIGWSPWITPC